MGSVQNNKLKLSVIIPYYNGLKYIHQTVIKLLSINTLKEILIIDDGSNDGTYDKLKQMFSNNNVVNIYRKKNGGISDARNFGLIHARGDYVLFVDQDDIVIPEIVNNTLEKMEFCGVECALWSTCCVFETGEKEPLCSVLKDEIVDKKIITSFFLYTLLLKKKNRWITCAGQAWGGLYKTSFLKTNSILFRKFVDYEDDLLFVLQVFLNAEKVLLCQGEGYLWRVNRKSYSHTPHYISNYIVKSEALRQYICEELRKKGISEEIINEYIIWISQATVISNIYNECINDRKVRDIRKLTKNILRTKPYNISFQGYCLHENRFYKASYILLRKKLYLVVIILHKYMVWKNKRHLIEEGVQ